MVSTLKPFVATTRDQTRKIHGRFYSAQASKAVIKGIHAQTNANGRHVHLEVVMEGRKLQPHIHDTIILVNYRGLAHRFHIFVKNHRFLRPNRIVAGWGVGHGWRGDIVVLKKGIVHEFVGFRSGDAALADFAVKRFVSSVVQRRRFYIPKHLIFDRI